MDKNRIRELLSAAAAAFQRGDIAAAETFYQQVLKARPKVFDALLMMGILRFQQRRLEEAERFFAQAVKQNAASDFAWSNRGVVLEALGRQTEALQCYERALAIKPANADAHFNRANVLLSLGRHTDALAALDRALGLKPAFPLARNNQGIILLALRRPAEALQSFEAALSIEPRLVEAWCNKGIALREMSQPADALAAFDAALQIGPRHAPAWSDRGLALKDLDRPADAMDSIDRALQIDPRYAKAHVNRAVLLIESKQYADALAALDVALALAPALANAHINRGLVFMKQMRFDDAYAALQRGLALDPASIDGLVDMGSLNLMLERPGDALQDYDRALALQPNAPNALMGRGRALRALDRFDEASEAFRAALAIQPDESLILSALVETKRKACDWAGIEDLESRLVALARDGRTVEPFMMFHVEDDPALQLSLSQQFWTRVIDKGHEPVKADPAVAARRDRLRVGYMSPDFRQHPMVSVIAEAIELHDRERLEVHGFSYGADDASPDRRRMQSAFEHFHDVANLSTPQLAQQIADTGIDILVDLAGYTSATRIDVASACPAPVICHYMGFPGTIGAPGVHYLIADPVVAPHSETANYAEALVRMPDSYWAVDRKREVAQTGMTRQKLGLPEHAVVLASFNGQQKLTPRVLDVWGRILAAAPEAVLWLYADRQFAADRLRAEVTARGISPDRVFFAGRVSQQEHLARNVAADLMLDTLPYGGHTTTADALWMGVPVLTVAGRSFASRVGASLLTAAGLPELVMPSLADYEEQAIALAREPGRLAALRERLLAVHDSCALFDTPRFVRHLEQAYVMMWQRHKRGERPAGFTVPSSQLASA